MMPDKAPYWILHARWNEYSLPTFAGTELSRASVALQPSCVVKLAMSFPIHYCQCARSLLTATHWEQTHTPGRSLSLQYPSDLDIKVARWLLWRRRLFLFHSSRRQLLSFGCMSTDASAMFVLLAVFARGRAVLPCTWYLVLALVHCARANWWRSWREHQVTVFSAVLIGII